jgi:3D-(3,5/4)-trihydroxycyclohexane-1,2-dione acylhydrolase (decyclizing)
MACTTSIGPGALNMVTAAALAHVNRLPVLLLPGDVFANRRPDPVLQQIEDFGDGTVTGNDCFRPVSRYFDRITRPEQIISGAAPRHAGADRPADCGPVTLSLCQDVQAEAYDYPESFFDERGLDDPPPAPGCGRTGGRHRGAQGAKKPVIIAGGGVLYSEATDARELRRSAWHSRRRTQAGKSSLPERIRSTWARSASPARRRQPDGRGCRRRSRRRHAPAGFHHRLLVAVQERQDDHRPQHQAFDAAKHEALPLVADARVGLDARSSAGSVRWKAPAAGRRRRETARPNGWQAADKATATTNAALPSDAQVIGAVQRAPWATTTLVCAAGGLPGELHKLWQADARQLSHGIRLLDHGLRDRRRARRQDGASPTGCRRHGRRRLLHDDEFRDRLVGDARA